MNKNNIPIIALGVTISSLELLKLFFRNIVYNSGCSYIIIPDKTLNPPALIKELSDTKIEFPIEIVEEGKKLEANKIYLNPSDVLYIISSNQFRLKKMGENKNLTNLLSIFWKALAAESKEGSTVISLSDPDRLDQKKEAILSSAGKTFFEKEYHKLLSIPKQTKSSIIITDVEGKINYVNESFLKLSGYDEGFVMNKKPGDLLQGKDTNPKTVKIMREAISKKKGFEVDIINYSKSGKKYWTNINCEPLLDQKSRFIGFFSIQTEISAKKDYEEQIESLNQLLKSRNSKLAELNKSLEEFAYIASHDLKEPARNIKSILELILRKSKGKLDKKLIQYMDMAVFAGDKMNRLINSLLQFSRSGILNEELKTIKVEDSIKELKFSLNSLIEEHSAEIIVNDKIEKFQAYPILFGRLLQNLVQNAIKYRSESKPKITITTNENELSYIFSVADNGIGISERDFERVFKVFQKVHDKDSQSHGIGLAVCKKIVETHLGEITLESQEGLGSTFHFTISKQLQ